MKNTILLICALALIPLSMCLLGDTNSADRQQLIFQNIFLHHEYVFERNFQAAQACLEEALRLQPDNPVPLFHMSSLLREDRGREDEAKLYLKRAMDNLDKATPGERLYLDQIMLHKYNDLSRAEFKDKIDSFLKKYPNDGLVHYAAGRFYQFNMGDFNSAIPQLEKALRLMPWLAQGHNLLGYAYSAVGNQRKAIRHLESYAAVFPTRANPHDSLGEIYLMTGQYPLAIEQFNAALAIAPDFTAVRLHLISAYKDIGQYARAKEQALILLEKAEADSIKSMAYTLYADVCIAAGDYEKAERKIRTALELRPDDFYSLYLLGQIQLESGRMEEVQQTLHSMKQSIEELTKKYPSKFSSESSFSTFEVLQARVNIALGNFDTAIETLSRIDEGTKMPSEGMQIGFYLAEAYFAIGDFDQALEITRSYLRMNPNHVRSLLLQAKIYTSLSRHKEAVAALDRCDEILQEADPGSPILDEINRLRQITVAMR
jgi:tetratricopeptide (TPR) repeat protein